MFTYNLEERTGCSKYEYLYRCIRRDIRSGVIRAGAKLPAKRAFAEQLGVSVTTVEQAYDLLVSEGYVQARRGSGFYVSPGRALERRIDPRALSTDEEDSWRPPDFDFKANKCSLGLFPKNTWLRIMRRTLSESNQELFETVPFNGLASLREAIASYLYESKGIVASPSRIIVGAGTEYLYSRLLQLFGARTIMAIGDPGYKKLGEISRSRGTLWEYIPVDAEGVVVNVLRETPAEVVHVSPANHFPMGIEMSTQRRVQLLEWAAERAERYIIEDDYDSELRFSGRAQPPLFTQDAHQKVIYLNTFSKTLVPSLRISYMVLPKPLMDLYSEQMSFYSCTVSGFEQDALARFISGGYFERHINRLRRYYEKQRAAVVEAIEKSSLSEIAKVRDIHVGTHFILSVNSEMSDSEIVKAADGLGMHLAMLSDYCAYPTARMFHHVVINFASIDPNQIEPAVQVFEKIFARDIEEVRKQKN